MIIFGSMMMGVPGLAPPPAVVGAKGPDSGGTTFTSYPAGTQVGDRVLVIVGGLDTGTSHTLATVTGWFGSVLGSLTNGGDYGKLGIYEHTVSGSFGSAKSFNFTASVNAAVMISVRNWAGTDSATGSLGSAASMPSAPSLSVDSSKSWTSVIYGGIARTTTGADPVPTPPAGFSAGAAKHSSGAAGVVCVMVAYKEGASPDSPTLTGGVFGGTPYGASANHGNRGGHTGLRST